MLATKSENITVCCADSADLHAHMYSCYVESRKELAEFMLYVGCKVGAIQDYLHLMTRSDLLSGIVTQAVSSEHVFHRWQSKHNTPARSASG